MMLAGGKIKEVQISLMLSSRNEMQKIIEAARQASMSSSLAQLLAPPVVSVTNIPQQQFITKERRDSKSDKKDSSDLSSSSHETGKTDRRDRRDKSRSRSRERNRKDRRDKDRDRDRDRRRRSRSRSRSRDRRRRRSRSRSRGRDRDVRDRERKDSKDVERKDEKMVAVLPALEPGTNVPNLDILNPSTWSVMQTGALAQNAHLLTNFEFLRSLANQKGPLIPGGPTSLLPTPLSTEMDTTPELYQNMGDNLQGQGDFPNRGPDFNRNKGDNPRGRNQRGFKNFDEGNFQENNTFGGGDGRFDRNRNQKNFQNFGPNFGMRNGNDNSNKPRFGNFGRPDNGFLGRGGPDNRERPNMGRGLLDLPDSFGPQDRFSNRDDRVDEFGRSIQLRNRRNASNDGNMNDEVEGNGGEPPNFTGLPNRFGKNQPNQKPPPLLRGRESWPTGRNNDNFQDRRGFREDMNRGFKPKGRDFGKLRDDVELLEKDCCVEIRNLSPQIAYGEVRRPFSNQKLIIKEIKFLDYTPKDKKCRIRFLNNENKRKAIQISNKILIDNKQVHLLHINDSDFDDCVDEGVKRPEVKFSDDEDDSALTSKDVYVQVNDLPVTAEERDVISLFPNMTLDKVLLETSPDGKNKTAFLKFQKAVDAKVVLGTPNRNFGDSAISLVPLPQFVFNDHLNKPRHVDSKSPEIMEVDISKPETEASEKTDLKSTCILMKNLPTEANDRDICDFFSDIGLVPNKIHLMLDIAGQPSGDAFCEFSDPQQTERACTKNFAHLGKNVVSVAQVDKSEMMDALGVTQPENNIPSLMESFGRPQCVVSLENIPFRATVFDIINFFGWSYHLNENDVLRRYNEKGQPTGDGKVCFRTHEDALRAIRFLNNRSLLGRVIRMKLV